MTENQDTRAPILTQVCDQLGLRSNQRNGLTSLDSTPFYKMQVLENTVLWGAGRDVVMKRRCHENTKTTIEASKPSCFKVKDEGGKVVTVMIFC